MRALLLGLSMLAAGCNLGSAGARGPGAGDPLKGITVTKVNVALSQPPVTAYGGAVDQPLTAMEEAIASALGSLPMQHLPPLSRVARELARTTPDRTNVPSALTDGLMAWAGLPDPHPRFIMIELPDDTAGCLNRPGPGCNEAVVSLVRQVQTTISPDETLYYGVGVARAGTRGTRMVVAVVDRMVVLKPMPTAVRRGGQLTVEGELVGRRRRPSVEVVDPQGRWRKVQTSLSVDGTFRAAVPCGNAAGAYQVEVLCEGVYGVEVAANFRVYCGARSPTRLAVEVERVDPSVGASQVAQANLLYLNRERKRQGLKEVAWDARAANVALGHSKDMARNGFFGHRSPSTGDVASRFSRARITSTQIRENLARGYGPKGMHDSLMASPGHRVNILAADVTHIGIGCVEAEPEGNAPGAPRAIFCTQNFFKKPGAGAPPDRKLVSTMRGKVDEARARMSIPPAQWDRGLDAVAGRAARAVASNGRMPKGWEQDVFDLGYASVETHQVRSPDFDALSTVKVWTQPALAAGIGIARVRERDGDAFLMIVLVAER